MALPVVGVAVMVNITVLPGTGLAVDVVIETVGFGALATVTDADAVDVSPNESVPVTTTRYEPGAPYACVITFGWPVKFCVRPSPQSTRTLVMGLVPAAPAG